MADQLYFSRDTKCYIEFNDVVWEMPVLDGFSFSQANSTSEISLAEMEDSSGTSRRGRRAFNDALDPGEWSMSTYVRPFTSAGSGTGKYSAAEVHAVEEVLWGMFAGATSYNTTSDHYERGSGNDVIAAAAASLAINFDQSNKTTVGTANIYFVLGDENRSVIKLKDAVVNEASIDFDIDGIATINWSGLCSEVLDFTGSTIEDTVQPVAADTTQDGGTIAIGDVWLDSNDGYRLYVITNVTSGSEASTAYRNEDINETDNFIRNRLSQLDIALDSTQRDPDSDSTNELQASYSLTLTGGNITLSNNITYITPEELGKVNTPFAHVTGGRNFGGNFTCYLTLDTSTFDSTKSRDLFDDLRSASNVVTNSFDLTFKIGGGSGNRLEINFPTAHLEIPTHSIEDVISLETNFMALPSTISETDEATLTYKV